MSISSMLGGEPVKARDGPPLNGTSYSRPPSVHHSNASSPTKPYYGNGAPHGSPPMQHNIPGPVNRFRASSGGHTSIAKGPNKHEAPSHSRFRSNEVMSQVSPRSEHGAPVDWRARHGRHSDPANFMQRPLSQPSGPNLPPEHTHKRSAEYNAIQPTIDGRERSNRLSEDRQAQDRAFQFLTRQNNDRPPVQAIPHPSQQPEPKGSASSNYPFLSNRTATNPAVRPANELNRPIEAKQSVQKGPLGPEALRRIRDDRLGASQYPQPKSAPPEPRQNLLEALDEKRSSNSPKYHPAVLAMERSESFDKAMQHAKDGENAHHKSLALALENNRRHGRLSPLPQAVQGAQSQSNGPSRDPSIKNEFSKMFAGIGSGVSSAGLAGSGTSTPYPPSPKVSSCHYSQLRIPRLTCVVLTATFSFTSFGTSLLTQSRLMSNAFLLARASNLKQQGQEQPHAWLKRGRGKSTVIQGIVKGRPSQTVRKRRRG